MTIWCCLSHAQDTIILKVEIPLFDDGENILAIQAAAMDPVLGMLTEMDR